MHPQQSGTAGAVRHFQQTPAQASYPKPNLDAPASQMSQKHPPPLQVEFWTFTICHNTRCSKGFKDVCHGAWNIHLVLDKIAFDESQISQSRDRLFAISYTWGRTPHKKQYLGHSVDGQEHYTIELGPEWNRENFVRCLDSLSHGSGGLRHGWLDQLAPRTSDKSNSSTKTRTTESAGDVISSGDAGPNSLSVANHVIKKIPFIFRSCEVFALFPGQRCRCITRVRQEGTSPMNTIDRANTSLPECLNYIGLVSWWGRLWPRQEFMYAAKITIKWTGSIDDNQTSSCVRSDRSRMTPLQYEQLKGLTKLCRMHFEDMFWLHARSRTWTTCHGGACRSMLRSQPWRALEMIILSMARDNSQQPNHNWTNGNQQSVCSCTVALARFMSYQSIYYETMRLSLEEKIANPDARPTLQSFLGGQEINTPAWYSTALSLDSRDQKLERLNRFAKHLGLLGRSDRQATQAKDMVGAVWPDCPECSYSEDQGSTSSKDYRILLEDCVEQVQRHFTRAFITTAPSGLFNPRNQWMEQQRASWLWEPRAYLADEATMDSSGLPKSTSYVYGTLSAPFRPVRIFSDPRDPRPYLALQMMSRGTSYRPLSKGAQLFEELYPPEANKEHVHMALATIVEQWPRYVRSRCVGPEALVLRKMLKKRNMFVVQTVLPLLAIDEGLKLSIHSGLVLRELLMNKKLSNAIAVKIAGKHNEKKVTELLDKVRNGAIKAEKAVAREINIESSELRQYLFKIIGEYFVEQQARRIKHIKESRPYQTMRDQIFFDGVLREQPHGNVRQFQPVISAPHSSLLSGEQVARDPPSQDQYAVMHIDIVYYMVAEALGFHPKDIGLDYDNSWQPEHSEMGKAYERSKLRLMVSRSEPPMLGFTHLNREQLENAPDGSVMTVTYMNKGEPVPKEDGDYGNCCYEVHKSSDGSWSIVGVWVPVKNVPWKHCAAWFGEGASTDAKLC